MGGDMGSFMEGLAGGVQQGQKNAQAAQFLDAQMKHLKAQNKASELALQLEQIKANVLGSMSPEEQRKALFPKSIDPMEMFNAISGGGAPQAAPAPALPWGGGTEQFPLDPSVTAPASFSQQAAGLLTPKWMPTIDSTGKVTLKQEDRKTRRRETVGPDGLPVSILETEEGVGIPGGALPVPVKLEERKKTLSDGSEVSYDVNPYTGEPVGEMGVSTKKGPSFRVSAPPPVEEFKYTDESGVEMSVIRKKATGEHVTTPVPVAPPKGILSAEAGKVEGATKALRLFGGIKDALINKDGSINRSLVLKIWTPGGGIGDGRKFLAQFREGLDVKTRVMSGAAIRPEEEAMYKAIYIPHPLDNDETAKDKLKRFEETMNGLRALIDPSGIGTKRIEKATGGKKLPGKGKKDPSKMTDAELVEALGGR